MMKCWKNNFNETTLKTGLKYKDKIENINYNGYSFKAIVKAKKEYNVELIIEDNILYDMNCTCSRKSSCAHQAGLLYFLEEFPEILEDFTSNNQEKITDIDINEDLKVISDSKLKKFLKKEFKKNPKFKYDFIKYFKNESLIDTKSYEKKLNQIFRNGGKEMGYYKLHNMRTPLKNFMKKDIYTLIEHGEYKSAFKLLNKIMDRFTDQLYWNDPAWYEIAYYYREYSLFILKHGKFSESDESHVMKNVRIINTIVF